MKRVRITHLKDGTVELEAEGFRGAGCREFTAPFEAALGLDPSGRVDTAEALQSEDAGAAPDAG